VPCLTSEPSVSNDPVVTIRQPLTEYSNRVELSQTTLMVAIFGSWIE